MSAMETPIKPLNAPSQTPSSTDTTSPDGESPIPAEPSPQSFPMHQKVYVEGIPEHLNNTKKQRPSQETESFDSLLSSLEDEDQLSFLAEEASMYFTPLEEPPTYRMDRLKQELQLRTELLQYLSKELPTAYAQHLLQQEQAVQQQTLRQAQIKETERQRRKAERRRQRGITTDIFTRVAPKSLHFEETTPQPTTVTSWSYFNFEWHHGLPAVASLVLVCVAHMAVYETVLAIVMVCLQPFTAYRIITDDEDRILETGHNSVEDICYAVVLLVGLLVARCSGLLFSFRSDDDDDDEVAPWNNTAWAQWLRETKKGRRLKGFLDVLSFYLCFVAVMYFLGRFALCVDQRSTILENMPSNFNAAIIESSTTGICPNSSEDSDDSDDSEDDYDYDDDAIVWEGGHEDEAYLYERLSASAYHQVFGNGYRAALFDLPHQVFYNLACSAIAIYTLRRYFGVSFWDDW